MTTNIIKLNNAPEITGLSFRHFLGESDYPKMVKVIDASAEADKIERADAVEDIANNYAHLTNCDPYLSSPKHGSMCPAFSTTT